jgi:uncharacterized protein (DUF2141 family)
MQTGKGFRVVILALALMAVLVFSAQSVLAADGTFNVSVYHGINGRSLGLSRELPVDVEIWKDGSLLTRINDFTFKTRIETALPAGTYEIRVFADELGGARLDSMTVGPVEIPEGVNLRLQANLAEGKTPVIRVNVK